MEQPILLALIALVSSAVTLTIPKILSKKKDALSMFAELQEKLHKEIERLEIKIKILEQREEEAYIIEEKLTKRILELEQENIRQSNEIEQFKAQLSKHVKDS